MQTIKFSKMHGLGNDFVVIDAVNQQIDLSSEQIRFLADRHRGIGCDQLLLVERPPQQESCHPTAGQPLFAMNNKNIDFRYRIFNADGGEVEQCGNGARCFARFVYDKGLTDKERIVVQTHTGIIHPRLETDGMVSVEMGLPNFSPAALPFSAERMADQYELETEAGNITIGAVSMGNPHAVTVVDSVDNAPVAELGPLISRHERFPQGVNAGFMEIIDRGRIRLRVYERGAGETQACGTGACAAVVVGRRLQLLDETVIVELTGGSLTIHDPADGSALVMTGPATHVFDGQITL